MASPTPLAILSCPLFLGDGGRYASVLRRKVVGFGEESRLVFATAAALGVAWTELVVAARGTAVKRG